MDIIHLKVKFREKRTRKNKIIIFKKYVALIRINNFNCNVD